MGAEAITPMDTNPLSKAKYFYLRDNMPMNDIIFTTDLDSIAPLAFYGYKGTIDNITVSSGIEHLRIGKNAFTGVTATNLIIGTDLKKVTGALPQGKNVKYAGNVKEWCDIELSANPAKENFYIGGQDMSNHLDIPEGVTFIPNNHFNGLGVAAISLPSTVTEIAEGAFYGCNGLKSISQTELKTKNTNTLNIGKEAFAWCTNLKDINLDNIEYVGEGAFAATEWYWNLPDGLITIGNSIYKYKGDNMPENTIIDIPEGIKYISGRAFEDQEHLISVSFPSSLQFIGRRAFYHCSITDITLPPFVSEINEDAFYWNNLSKLIIPSTIIKLGKYSFGNNPITELIIEDSNEALRLVDEQDFGNKLDKLYIGRNIESQLSDLFYNKLLLENITFGKNVSEINQFFNRCNSLKHITCLSAVPPIVTNENWVFSGESES